MENTRDQFDDANFTLLAMDSNTNCNFSLTMSEGADSDSSEWI